jgi:hypothetical protein
VSERHRSAAALLVAVAVASCTPQLTDPLPGYRAASADQRAAVMRTIEDYYSRRARAALTGDTTTIFVVYPKLAQAEDRTGGMNTDAFFVERMRNLGVTDVQFEIEEREPARVYTMEGRAVAFVHGKETWRYLRGDVTIGEFYTRLDLFRESNGWQIDRTDEVMLGERPPRTPAP